MNRLEHLKITLKENLKDLDSYRNIEFLILDYGSREPIYEHIKSVFPRFLDSGNIKLFRVEATQYNMSHSRNVAFKLATGDILCNIDADNYVGYGFARYIREVFEKEPNVFLTCQGNPNHPGDVRGRLCVKRRDFFSIRGYDERMIFYGFDDYDIVNRLTNYGLRQKIITDDRFVNFIRHNNRLRVSNFRQSKIKRLLVLYHSPFKSEMFFLFDGGSLYKGTVIINNHLEEFCSTIDLKSKGNYKYILKEDQWELWSWNYEGDDVAFHNGEVRTILEKRSKFEYRLIDQFGNIFELFQVTDGQYIESALMLLHETYNRNVYLQNKFNNVTTVNNDYFGDAEITFVSK